MTTQQLADKLAQELRLTRLAMMQIVTRQAGYPGLVGISPKAGARSVEAILEDFTRTVAHVLADEMIPGFSYARFMNPTEEPQKETR